MAKKFVRSLKDVKDIQQLSKNIIEENDIVSTEDGSVYIVTKTDFIELGGSGLDTVKTDITTLKSENTKLKNRVTTLETENTNLKSSVTTLETDYQTLSDRVTALETPSPTE